VVQSAVCQFWKRLTCDLWTETISKREGTPEQESRAFAAYRLPSGRHHIPPELVAENQRWRLLGAAAEVLAERGYAHTKTADIRPLRRRLTLDLLPRTQGGDKRAPQRPQGAEDDGDQRARHAHRGASGSN
jgi:hypothetical protein